MNLDLLKNRWRQPTDDEIDRDVAELRQILERVEGPKEPHPAYYQNFLVKVRGRIDEERFQRRRVAPSTIWASLTATAVVVALVVGGVFTPSTREIAEVGMGSRATVTAPSATEMDEPLFGESSSASSDLLADNSSSATYTNGTTSLVLNDDDVKMLNAIMSDDDDALFEAMADSEGI
jgi:hypothetical protein